MVILIRLRSMRGSGTLVLDTDWSTNSSTTTLFLACGLDRRLHDDAVRGGLVVDQQLTKLHAGLRIHVLELAGRAVEHLVEVLVDLAGVDAGQDLRVGDRRLLGLLARMRQLTLLPQHPTQSPRDQPVRQRRAGQARRRARAAATPLPTSRRVGSSSPSQSVSSIGSAACIGRRPHQCRLAGVIADSSRSALGFSARSWRSPSVSALLVGGHCHDHLLGTVVWVRFSGAVRSAAPDRHTGWES